MSISYQFKYMPLVGKLPGESMAQQTETAINEIAEIVNENVAQAEIINTLAQDANNNSVEALEKANEALQTTGRVYVNIEGVVNLDNYCQSELLWIRNASSTNLPIQHSGFLEVKTNSDKTHAEQIFIDDSSGIVYSRAGTITAQQVGDVINYVASYGEWQTIATNTYVTAELQNYLPLSGGTMTGDLKASYRFFGIRNEATNHDGQLAIFGGGANNNGAYLSLNGMNANSPGYFSITAHNGTNSSALQGKPDGTLTWGGNNIALAKDYLPLAGGTMTGLLKTSSEIRFYTDSGRLGLNGGNTGGAYLNMYGKDHAQWPGLFSLTATDGTNNFSLQGASDGTLKWRGYDIALAKDVLPLSGGTMTGTITFSSSVIAKRNVNDSNLSLYAGSDATGAYISMWGKNNASSPGVIQLRCSDGTNNKSLLAYPNGNLVWDGKNIEQVNASGSNYIRYENGIQICWRSGANFDTNGTQIVFPVPFKDATYAVNVTTRGLTTSTNIALPKVTTKDSAGFVAMAVATSNTSSFSGGTLDYIAIGLWK